MIYLTLFLDDEDKTIIEHSTETGLTSLDQVVELLGEPIIRSRLYAIYDGQIYSTIIWSKP